LRSASRASPRLPLLDQRVETEARDARDLAQRLGHLRLARVLQPPREGLHDRGAVQAAHGDDEGEAELLHVTAVQVLQPRELLRRAVEQAAAALLLLGEVGHLAAHRRPPRQLGVGADQREPPLRPRLLDRPHHRRVQRRARGEGPVREGALRHPRGVLEHAAEARDEILA
jgi:hypothetical protein